MEGPGMWLEHTTRLPPPLRHLTSDWHAVTAPPGADQPGGGGWIMQNTS